VVVPAVAHRAAVLAEFADEDHDQLAAGAQRGHVVGRAPPADLQVAREGDRVDEDRAQLVARQLAQRRRHRAVGRVDEAIACVARERPDRGVGVDGQHRAQQVRARVPEHVRAAGGQQGLLAGRALAVDDLDH